MAAPNQEIDLRALESRAKLAQSVNGFVSGYMKNRVCYSMLTIVGSLLFTAVTIAVLVSTSGDCGLGGSIRAYLAVLLVLMLATLFVTVTFEVLIRRGTVLKHPRIASCYGHTIRLLTFLYCVMALVGTILLFGDSQCYDDFYSGFVLALVLLILMYLGIVLFSCLFCLECWRNKRTKTRQPGNAA